MSQWSAQQERALDAVGQWFRSQSKQLFRIDGLAGTGKTTLARHFAEHVNGQVFFCAMTGKAAHVLLKKGCPGARTIHSLIYKARDRSKSYLLELEEEYKKLWQETEQEGKNPEHSALLRDLMYKIQEERKNAHQPIFKLNVESELRNAKLVVVDEMSMVSTKMAEDLLSFGVPVLTLGDPAQLPPVKDAGFATNLGPPDVFLDEIHRQAGESPIIRMAHQLRLGKPLELGHYGEGCRVIRKIDLREEPRLPVEVDQVLVGMNKTRTAYNLRMRELLGAEGPFPEPGDKVVCLRNNHDEGLLNGAQYEVLKVYGVLDNKVQMSIKEYDTPPEHPRLDVSTHEHYFLGRAEHLHWTDKMDAEEFDYGYAMTVHKAQGSQWRDLLVFDESGVFRKDRWKWAYTAITRAEEKVTWVV